MRTTILTAVALLVMTAGAHAAPVLSIQNVVFENNEFRFDLVLDELGVLDGLPIVGFAAGAVLTGSGTDHLLAACAEMRYSTSEWQQQLAAQGSVFAWSSLAGATNSANWSPATGPNLGDNSGPVDGTLVTWIMVDNLVVGTSPEVGDVVAQFRYVWDGVLPDAGSITIQIVSDGAIFTSGDSGWELSTTGTAYFLGPISDESWQIDGVVANTGAGLPGMPMAVANNFLAIPEPATMGLLGLGLVALVVRRRR